LNLTTDASRIETSEGAGVAERRRQRARTDAAIVEATGELLRAGLVPTVEEAAEAAGVSRATAYRYYSSQEELLAAVIRDAVAPFAADEEPETTDDVDALVRQIIGRALENLGVPDDAAQLSDEAARRLAIGLSVLFHVESYVVCREFWDLEHDDATEVLRWAGKALLLGASHADHDEPPPPP
jgi:AcrR family transcriptional regulator